MADEQVRFDVSINARAAVKELREMSQEATSVQERVAKFSQFLVQKSQAWNVPVQQLLNTFKQLNAEMAKNKKQTIFGNVGGQNIFNLSGQYLQAAQAAGLFKTANNGVVSSVKKTGDAMEEAGKKSQGFRHGIDLIRTALGTLVAVGIFQFLNAITSTFTELIHNIRETELAVYNLINAEKRLSEQGIDVTPKGLQEIIESVRELVPILSQIQAEELVSRIATNVAPSLKLTTEQIRQMAEATALLYVRNKALGKSFDEVESQLTNAFLTGKVSVGINNLGVKINDQIVKDEALRLGLVKTEEQFDRLTGEMEAQIKASAMLSVVYKNATQDVESISQYMETTDAAVESTTKAWSDLLTVVGQAFGPAIIEGLKFVRQGIEALMFGIEKAMPPLQKMVAFMIAATEAAHNLSNQLYAGRGTFLDITQVASTFKDTFESVMGSFKGLGDAIDTPTGAIEDLGDAIDDLDAEGLQNKIDDILEDAANAREDLQAKLSQKRTDIDTEYQRKALDAEVDYNRKVEDINRDYERDLAKLKEKHRQEDIRDEEKYQLQLWELRMRFLMDLEDALHARDARQVIRLQKQYEIDKEALARKHALDENQREEDQQAEQEDLALKREQRLEDARRDYEERLADQRLAKQRELDDLNVWYKREQDDIKTNVQRKLEALLAGWVQEKKITESNAAQVYAILAKYFGPGGMTDQLYAYMASKLSVPLPIPGFAGGGTGPAPYWQMLEQQNSGGSTGGGGSGRGSKGHRRMAEGGTLIATRPTSVTFGEAGAEMATFTPLSRLGSDVGKVFSSGETNGLNGQIVLSLNLSPDLEARVVEQSVNGVADVILKVNRTKV